METVYLKDGTKANLIAKTDKGYVVDPFEIYRDYEWEEEYTEASGNVRMVDKVYAVAPLEVVQEEYKEILSKVQEQETFLEGKRKELREIQHEIASLKNTKTDLNRYIINREELKNAKRLILFKDHCIMPTILDGLHSRKFTVSYEISQYQGEERCWAYQIWSENRDYGWSGPDYFDPEYGIRTDLTDEEIKAVAFERLRHKKKAYFHEHDIRNTPDEWLTPEYIELKAQAILNKDRVELEKAEKELNAAKEKYERLSQKTLTVS